jgi:hypothetical protein
MFGLDCFAEYQWLKPVCLGIQMEHLMKLLQSHSGNLGFRYHDGSDSVGLQLGPRSCNFKLMDVDGDIQEVNQVEYPLVIATNVKLWKHIVELFDRTKADSIIILAYVPMKNIKTKHLFGTKSKH